MTTVIKNATEPCACGETVIRCKKTNECSPCYQARRRAANLDEIRRKEREAKRAAYVPAEKPQEPRTAPNTECSYTAAHKRVARHRGFASEHLCVGCGKQAEEWSYRGGSGFEQTGLRPQRKNGQTIYLNSVWSSYIGDYDPRCIECHKEYDAKM
jgi:hypothetical protein